MHVLVNGGRLFFDVEGAKLVPNGPAMREKPTLILLHGGPGFDHSIYKPAYSALAESAQIVYLDHRGNGRSEDGLQESWNLAQWGDDVRVLRRLGHSKTNRAERGGWGHGRAGLRHTASNPSLQAGGNQYRSRWRYASGPACRAVRTLWRLGSRCLGASPVPRGSRSPRPSLARRLAKIG